MKTSRLAVAAILAVGGISTVAWAAGTWSNLPIIGGAAFCTQNNANTGAVGGVTGQSGINTICSGSQTPAGPATFTGSELVPMDTPTQTQSTVTASITQFGQGPIVTGATAAGTIPNGTPTYAIAAGTSATTTLPSAPIHGQIQRIILGAAQTTAFTVAANTGQTCLPSCPFTAPTLTAGTVYAWMYNAPTSQWVKIQ